MAKKRSKSTMSHNNKWTANKREVRRGLGDVKKITAEYLTVCGVAVAMSTILRKVLESLPKDGAPSPAFVIGVRTVTAKVKVIRLAVTALEAARAKINNTTIPAALIGERYEDALLDIIVQLGEVNEIGGHVNDTFIVIADTVVELCELVIDAGGEVDPDILAQIEQSKIIRNEVNSKQESK